MGSVPAKRYAKDGAIQGSENKLPNKNSKFSDGAKKPKRLFREGMIVMICRRDGPKGGRLPREQVRQEGGLIMGEICGACAGLQRNHWEYSVLTEANRTECVDEQHVYVLDLYDVRWVSWRTRLVAVKLTTHGNMSFAANIMRRNWDMSFEVKFVHDSTILDGVPVGDLKEPDDGTLFDASPESTPEAPLWLQDRKKQANIDVIWPLNLRIQAALERVKVMRPAWKPPLRGPFTGKHAEDSEGLPAHPAPLPELSVNAFFVDTWGKYCGKVKFATTYKIGPGFPRFDHWIDRVDASEPLYVHAALPVYAGLICLGDFQEQAEWVRPCDVALVGLALYVEGDLWPGFTNPVMETKFDHECCHFIPGCTSTYLADMTWVGGVFCLAPTEDDHEVRDDIYNIEAYHKILRTWSEYRMASEEVAGEITITVNLVLSTNYLANLRQVCSGSIRVTLSNKGQMVANVRIRDVRERRYGSEKALKPTRVRKLLSEGAQDDAEAVLAAEAAAAATPALLGAADLPALPAPPSAAGALPLPSALGPAAAPAPAAASGGALPLPSALDATMASSASTVPPLGASLKPWEVPSGQARGQAAPPKPPAPPPPGAGTGLFGTPRDVKANR
eukprot:TRINITY_DN54159_c0_g1_i1.p1 TRINITY_DN54159_c0_g1~~TRINITY_DN54159_c0_g1_i1.p1  ORF type:complete len:617 (+),score=158.44 TRINITY_DN54159_c0_g1_i1:282-2132(+)